MTRPPTKKHPPKGGRKPTASQNKPTTPRSTKGREIQKLKRQLKQNPADEEVFVKLWDIYNEAAAWEAMVELLENRISVLSDEREKTRALVKLGSLYDEKLGDARKAIDSFERVRTIDPQNRRALWALGVLHHDLEDWEKVVEIYFAMIDLAESPEEKLALRAQLAQIYEQRLQQEDQALLEYIRAARLAPQNVRILLNLEKLATRTESFRELLAIYEDVVERIARTELKIALYLKLARLYTKHLDDKEKAVGYYRRALELSGEHVEKLFSISNIYGEEEEWEELIAIYHELIQLAESPKAKSRLRREISRLYRHGLSDLNSAFLELIRVARYDPEQEGLVEEIIELGIACEKHKELSAILEDLAAHQESQEKKADLQSRLSRLQLVELHRPDLARQTITRTLEIAPTHIPSQLVWFDLLEAGNEHQALVEALESFLSRKDLPSELVNEQHQRLDKIRKQKPSKEEQVEEPLPENRAALLPRAPSTPGEPPEEPLRKPDTWDDSISLLSQRMAAAVDHETAANIALEIADIYENKLSRTDQAFFELVRISKQATDNQRLLDELFRLAIEAGFITEVVAVADDLAVTIDSPAAASMNVRIGLLYEAEGNRDEALARYRRAFDLDPVQETAYQKLCKYLESASRWEDLVELELRHASHLTGRKEKIEILFNAAEILEEKIGNDGRAGDVYDRILGLDANTIAAQKALQRLRGEAGRIATIKESPDVPTVDATATSTQPPAQEEAPIGDEVVFSPPPIEEKVAEPVAAPEPALKQPEIPLEPLIEGPAQESAKELVSATRVQEAEDAEPSPPPQPIPPADQQLFMQLEAEPEEELETSPMEEEPTARVEPLDPMMALRQKVRLDPDDIDSWEKLTSSIEEKEGDQAAFETLLEGTRLITSDEHLTRVFRRLSILAKTTDLRMRLAKCMEEHERSSDAESAYRTMLRESPAHEEALDGLYRIYKSRSALDRYDAILTRTLKEATDPKSRRALLLRRAKLRANQLDRPREALLDLEQLSDMDEVGLEAIVFKEEILKRCGFHEELAKTYQRHLDLCKSKEERVDLLNAVAELYENCLDAPEKAISFYRKVLEENPEQQGACDSLISLLEKKRDWLVAIELIEDATRKTNNTSMANRLRYRRGKILEEQLLRPDEAEAAYRQAIENPPYSVEALAALKSLARRRSDWVEVIQLGKAQLEAEERPAERAKILSELARVWHDKLENENKALDCYEKAYQLDPDNLDAAQVVADARFRTRRHEEAHELLERLAKRGTEGKLDPKELAAICLKLAQTAEALDRPEEASEAFEQALKHTPTDHQVLTQYGYHLARQGRWEKAVELYQEILERYHAKLLPNELTDIHCLAAQGLMKLGKSAEAVLQYRQALKVNPRHLPALRASADLASQLGNFQEVVDLLGQLREFSPSPAARFKLSTQMGDILIEQLNQPANAIEAYQQAQKEDTNNIELLDKLRRALVRTERYQEAVAILDRLAHLSPADRQRARYLRIAGDIERERVDDDDRALDFYLRALRFAPLDTHAHGSAVKILCRMRDWSRLAALYEELLKRLPPPITGQEDRRVTILTELIELYRYRLDDRHRAIAACEQLLSITSSDIKVREDLARLYEADGRLDEADTIHRSLIAGSPFSIDSYHALRRIYQLQGRRDRTLCIAATLDFLAEASQEEIQLLKEHRHALSIPPGRQIGEALYQRLILHPLAGGLLGEMFSFAADFARSIFVDDHREYKLKPRDRINHNDKTFKAAEVFTEALDLFGLPPPEIYGKGVGVKGILAVNTSPAAILFSEDALQRASNQEMRFMVGRAVVFTRPENLLATSLSARRLRVVLDAMVALTFPGKQVHPEDNEVTGMARKLGKVIPPTKKNRLHQLASSYLEQTEELSIRDWLEGIEHTCNRAGFLLCSDLEAAVQVLKTARVVSPSGSSRSLIRELIFYSISEDYFELRKAIRVSID